jgi:multiple sugar transport system permease protein/putative aldouronate transport system permease protein
MKNELRLTKTGFFRSRWGSRGLYLLLLVPVVYVIIFNYVPIYGVLMAFKRFIPRQGVWGSPWMGLYNFRRFFSSPNFFAIMRNTLLLSVYSIAAGFPFPLILAICVNHCFLNKYKKAVQTITFAPYFLSTVIVVGLVAQILDIRSGGVNIVLKSLGFKEINFMGSVPLFSHIYVWTNVWKSTGYSAVIYIASLASIDPTYHEAAIIDGASLWQRIWHIDLSGIRPIIVIMLILSMGGILSSDFERVYLMQTPLNLPASEVIATYVYKVGLGVGAGTRPDYSFGTAIGLFQNVVGVLLTIGANKLANAISGEGLF